MSTITYKQLSKALRRITALIKTPGLREVSLDTYNYLRTAHIELGHDIKHSKKETGYRKQHDTIPILRRKLDDKFSIYIRSKYRIKADRGRSEFCRCITCKGLFHWKDIDNGHFIKRQYTAVRFNEDNCRPQCKKCNGQDQGNDVRFRAMLFGQIGEERVLAIEANKKHYKHSRSELKLLIKHFDDKIKRLGG